MKDKMSRLQVLRLGAAAALGAASGGIAGLVTRNFVSVPPSAALTGGLSPDKSPLENREAFVENLSGSSGHFVLEAGNYLFDNAYPDSEDSEITVWGFRGKLTMLPAARIVFTDPTKRGLRFRGGMGAVIEGWNSAFQTAPTARYNARELLAFTGTTDTLVLGCRIEGSAAAGLLFEQCLRPQVIGLSVRNTMADGLHFANCADAFATDVLTHNTGDDGLAFLNYGQRRDLRGGTASNIRVYDAAARGISVIGQSAVIVSDFFVDGTAASGLIVAREESYDTRVPSDVRLSNGVVKNAGTLSESGESAQDATPRDGLFLSAVGNNISVSGVRILSPRGRGVYALYPDNARQIRLDDIHVENAGLEGVQIRDQAEVSLDEVVVQGSGGTGFEFLDNERVSYGRMVAAATSRTDPESLAFNFERNRYIRGETLQIEATDSDAEYSGTRVNASGDHAASGSVQSGVYGRIDHLVEPPATFELTNPSGLVGTTQGLQP